MSSSPSPSERRSAAYSLSWALPVLTGLAAYLWTAWAQTPGTTAVAGAGNAPARAQAAETRHTDVAALFEEFQQKIKTGTPRPRSEVEALAALSGEQLRQSFLDLTQRLKAAKDWGAGNDLFAQAARISAELGRREGEAGVTWVEDHLGDELYDCQDRMSGMDSWARQIRFAAIDAFAVSDPTGALAHITASTRQAPCSEDTVFSLLQTQVASGDAALKDAATRIPWELFDPGGQYFYMPGALPKGADLQPWIRSGTARVLVGQGIYIRGFFGDWAVTDPAQAIAAWTTWPNPSASYKDGTINEIFGRSAANPDSARRLDEVLAGMDETTAAEVLPTLRKSITQLPYLAPIYRDRFPHAFPAEDGITPTASAPGK
ncbi:MAG: hypothetical protein JWO82_1149 [Akkermansiaceae bacterium]|nr:hypothetical protein [Akkermansiaceae bacterium]